MIVGRVDEGDSRFYVDPTDPELVYESVTWILEAANNKPWLKAWAAKLGAEFAVDHLDLVQRTLAEVGRDAAVKLVADEARRRRNLMADIGTYEHDVFEALLLDGTIPPIPEHLVDVEVDGERVDVDAIADGLLNFLTDFDIRPERDVVLAEATVAHPVYGIAGTLDALIRFRCLPDDPLALIDAKSGKNLPTTINAQLAGYRHCTEIWVDQLGNKARMPRVDIAAVLHLRRDYERGYKLIEQPADDAALGYLLDCQKVLRGQKRQPKIKGRPLYPPLEDGTQPPALLEDLDHPGLGRCVGALRGAGIRDLADLAARTPAQLRAIKGIGPKSVEALTALLAEHGLTHGQTTREVA